MKVIVLLLLLISTTVFAQEIDNNRLLRMRDSLDNLLMVTPTSSPLLVKKGEIEVYFFNASIKATQFNDKSGNNANKPGQQSLFNSVLQLNFGISRSHRINAGVDLNFRSFSNDVDKNSLGSSFGVSGLSYFGPRVRIQPFKKLQNFTYQVNLWFPIAGADKAISLGASRYSWGNTFFYYKYIKPKVGIFAQANFTFGLPGPHETPGATTNFVMPLTIAASYVATKKDILFALLTYGWINDDVKNAFEGADSDYIQFAPGYQRVITKRFFANISYSTTLTARNYGKWHGLNFGVRVLL